MFKGKNIILGVTSSIAAYKSANVASALVKKGCNVNVLMTENATNFINPLTFEELTKHKCIIDTFDRNVQYNVAHISLAVSADAFIIAPASANVIGKIANGIADDMLTTTVMACKCPVIISPAMNTNMYENPIVQDNLAKLEQFGYIIVRLPRADLPAAQSVRAKCPMSRCCSTILKEHCRINRISKEKGCLLPQALLKRVSTLFAILQIILRAKWVMPLQDRPCLEVRRLLLCRAR